jgi:small ligand-binding sensory domain FIST
MENLVFSAENRKKIFGKQEKFFRNKIFNKKMKKISMTRFFCLGGKIGGS